MFLGSGDIHPSFIPFRLEKVQIVKYTSASGLTNIDVVGTGGLINSYLKDNELSSTALVLTGK